MATDTCVVLASGGMDSAVTIALANQDFELALLHVNYGQRTMARELQAFKNLAKHYGAKRTLVVNVEHLAQIGGSSLTDTKIAVAPADLNSEEVPTSYVPFRNGNLLAIATSWAEVVSASAVFVGAVEEDSSDYPDCRRQFYDAFEAAISAGTKPTTRLSIKTPIITLKKHEIVKTGLELGVPFELTWSCYQREDVACGICDSCAFRLRGFSNAGAQDPLVYAQRPSYS